jgi:hypothetical protein
MREILNYKCFCESSWEFLREDTHEDFLRMTLELSLQENLPLSKSHRCEGREKYSLRIFLIDHLPREL